MRLATGSVIEETPPRVIEWGQETGVIWIGAVLSVLLLLHLLASWAEEKGWIYYRRDGGDQMGAAFSNALAEFEAVLNPAAEYRILEERSEAILRSEAGQDLGDEESADDPHRTDWKPTLDRPTTRN